MDEDTANLDGYNVSLRKTRQGSECSMSSQRLEEIVGALMKPIKDLKQNFDMDINSLLEEYLTEAGLRQLDAGRSPMDDNLPNFAEVALLLQQSANIYSKKVDYLWIKVVEIVQSFGNNVEDVNDPNETEDHDRDGEKKTPRKLRRKDVEVHNFELIDLEEAANINIKENAEPKPLAVLPKNFIEFEPRVINDNDIQIKDYKGDLIGVSTDFRCNWNTDQNGMLCDDLDFCDEKDMLDMCSIEVTAATISSPPDSGHCSDYCGDGLNSFTPVNSDSDYHSNETFTSPKSEREYPDLSTLLENSDHCDTNANENTVVNETGDSSTLQTTVIEADLDNCKKRKAADEPELWKNKRAKFEFKNGIGGTAHLMKCKPCCFELPKAMIMKVLERRKNKLSKIRKKLGNYDVGDRTMDTQYLLDTFVAKCDEKGTKARNRRQLLKEVKVLATEWERDFLGFPDYSSKEDKDGFIGFDDKKTEILERHYAHSKILYNAAISKAMDPVHDEDDESECNYDTGTSRAEEDRHNPNIDGYEGDQDRRDSMESRQSVERMDAITQKLNAEAALEKNHLKCSKEQLEISRRVEEWHTSIRADLAKAERRKMFDLWSYSSRVLTSFSENGKSKQSPVISFNNMMKDKPMEDKARYFLATLMLANSQNLEIIPTNTVECKDFDMRLLSMERRITDDDFTC